MAQHHFDAVTLETIENYNHKTSHVVLMETNEDMDKDSYLEVIRRASVRKFGD